MFHTVHKVIITLETLDSPPLTLFAYTLSAGGTRGSSLL